MVSIEEQRQHFPALTNKVYFNFGGQGTLPDTALQAIISTYEYFQRQGPFSLEVNAWVSQQIDSLKQVIAELLGTNAADITLTENVTAGCNIVLWGIDWQAGDQILMSDSEHPGIIAAIQEIARRFQVEVVIYPLQTTLNQGNSVEMIQRYLKTNTRLLVLSHLLWNTGQVLPLSDIVTLAHQHSVAVLADAAQSVGCLPLNLSETGVDFYAFTGHKWLCGPAGVGGLYTNPEAIIHLQPTFIGWRGVKLNSQGKPIGWKSGGAKLEVATSPYPLYAGLEAAIKLHQSWGDSETRYQRICELSGYLWSKLAAIAGVQCLKSSPPEAGLVSFQLTSPTLPHRQVVTNLEQQGFQLRTIADPDCIRACVHYLTQETEIAALAEAIAQICACESV